MLSEKPNQKNISKLIDQRSKLQTDNQKNMLNFRLEMKEEFCIEMMGMMNGDKKCKTMASKEMKGSNKKGLMNRMGAKG